jgi:hypothetical protein
MTSLRVISDDRLVDSLDGLVSHTEKSDDSGWGTWEATSIPVVSLTQVEPSVITPTLPSMAMWFTILWLYLLVSLVSLCRWLQPCQRCKLLLRVSLLILCPLRVILLIFYSY